MLGFIDRPRADPLPGRQTSDRPSVPALQAPDAFNSHDVREILDGTALQKMDKVKVVLRPLFDGLGIQNKKARRKAEELMRLLDVRAKSLGSVRFLSARFEQSLINYNPVSRSRALIRASMRRACKLLVRRTFRPPYPHIWFLIVSAADSRNPSIGRKHCGSLEAIWASISRPTPLWPISSVLGSFLDATTTNTNNRVAPQFRLRSWA